MAQGRDESLGLPMAEGRVIDQPFSARAQPVVLAMFVLTEVSSIKPIRVSMLAMKGWRRVIQMWRAAATLGPLLLDGLQVFFVRQPEVPQQPPDRAPMHRHPMRRGDLAGQSGCRQILLLRNPAGHPVLQGGQLAMPAAIALSLWREAPVSFINLTMSLTNLTETLNRAAVDRCVFPSAT